MVGLRRRDMMKLYSSTPVPVPDWYITDGLLMHLDGINNTGNGHSNSDKTWVDLTGNGHDVTLTGSPVFGSNYIKPVRRGTSGTGLSRTAYKHVELVFKATTRSSSAVLHAQGNNVGTIWLGTGGGFYTAAGNSATYHGKLVPINSEDVAPITAISMEVSRNPSIIYLNGTKVTSDVSSTGTWGSNNSAVNWFSYAATTYIFSMPIYSLRFYDKVLTDAEVLNNWLVDKDRFNL